MEGTKSQKAFESPEGSGLALQPLEISNLYIRGKYRLYMHACSVLPQTLLPGGQRECPQTLNTDPCLP